MLVPSVEQLGTGPERPLIVCASDIFGGKPVCVAWLTTASVSAFHHSPKIQTESTLLTY